MKNKGNIKIINLKRDKGVHYDLYIGRANKWLNLPESKWANPFVMHAEYQREGCLELYEEHIRSRPDLLASLGELTGLTLACYCKPKTCHGDILIKLYDELV